jgi:hypothetical protein
MVMRRLLLLIQVFLIGVLASRSALSQTPEFPASRQFETRAELEARAKDAEAHHRTSEAWLLRQRLEKGDFQEGDRIILRLQAGNIIANDTLLVRAGKKVQLAKMEDLSLEGVLRSELNDRLTAHIGRYFREPIVRAVPLLRLQVAGAVGRPGYYYSSADVLLADMVMAAGGPTSESDLNKVVIRRGTDVIWPENATRTALSDGLSLDRLSLRAGDEVFIGRIKRTSWMAVAQVGVTLMALVLSLRTLR